MIANMLRLFTSVLITFLRFTVRYLLTATAVWSTWYAVFPENAISFLLTTLDKLSPLATWPDLITLPEYIPVIGVYATDSLERYFLEAYEDYFRCLQISAYINVRCPPKPLGLIILNHEFSPPDLVPWHVKFLYPMYNLMPYLPSLVHIACVVVPVFIILLFYFLATHLGIRRPIRMHAPRSPFTHTDITNRLTALLPPRPPIIPGNGHETLAAIRRTLEKACLDILYQAFPKVRDVGGNLTRNVSRGSNLHLCLPNLTAADRANFQQNPPANSYCTNKGQYCRFRERIRAAMLTYVDFYLSIDDLAATITGPTFIITHDFANNIGRFNWFNGEAYGEVEPGLVTMTTRSGTTYKHGYHNWKSEGVIVARSGAIRYRRVYSFGNSIIIYAFPVTGDFLPNDPDALTTSVPLTTSHIDSRTCYKFSPQDNVYKFIRNNQVITTFPAETIIRCAYMLSQVKRDEKFHATMNATIRTRMAADQVDLTYLPEATLIIGDLADKQVLDYNHKYSLLMQDVTNLTIKQRLGAKLYIWILRRAPGMVQTVLMRIFHTLLGHNKDHSLLPFLWTERAIQNYEVIDRFTGELNQLRLSAQNPFRAAGLAGGAAANPPPNGVPGPNPNQPGHVCQPPCNQQHL